MLQLLLPIRYNLFLFYFNYYFGCFLNLTQLVKAFIVILNNYFGGVMDDLDKRIIEELNKDSRLSFRELSKNLNIAVGTISHRIKKMEEEGVIKGYIPVVEPSKVGYDFIAVINVTIKRGKLQDVASLLDKFNNIVSIYNVTGNYDAVIIARFKNRGQLNNFVKELQTFENVDKTNTSLVLNTIKEDIRVKFD